jgi:YggT family protein
MVLFKAVVELAMVLLLVRLLIRPNEAFFHPLYNILYRLTDPILTPSRYITRTPAQGILLTVAILVVVRGWIYTVMSPGPLPVAVGHSFTELFQLLFQAYMVMWVIGVASGRGYGTPVVHVMARAFLPVDSLLGRLGISRNRFLPATFLLLWFVYAALVTLVRAALVLQDAPTADLLVRGLAEGLILLLALFPFPGFFSVVLIVGALLSWVSPDPRNPLVQTIYGISEPLLAPIRRFLPHLGGIDLSPIVALLAFQFLGNLGQRAVMEILRVFLS